MNCSFAGAAPRKLQALLSPALVRGERALPEEPELAAAQSRAVLFLALRGRGRLSAQPREEQISAQLGRAEQVPPAEPQWVELS